MLIVWEGDDDARVRRRAFGFGTLETEVVTGATRSRRRARVTSKVSGR
jgi:hypothetical protein